MLGTNPLLDLVGFEQATPGGPRFDFLPCRAPDDNLCGVGTRVWCAAMMLDPNRLAVTAGGLEQTRITYGFTRLIAKYDGLNIRGVKTQRTDGDAAQSFFVLSIVEGVDPIVLRQFGEEITRHPWFEPGGRRVDAASVGDLTVIARDRPGLLMDELEIVSGRYDANIETLVNEHFYGPKYYPLLKPALGAGREGRVGRGGRTNYRYSEFVSFTRMRLELEAGADIRAIIRDLEERGRAEARESGCGTEWRVEWEERPQRTPAKTKFGNPN